ncbi:MAG: GvpL/GvpF family gas vesicle protein [Planctomycetia bacterium]|nr:GvpL/GvpF family gas vesicle protein [Planctomycetia bacterium]
MGERHHYVYALTWPDCQVREIGPGVDADFPVELVRGGPVAAVVSRVDMDRLDVRRFAGETAEDIAWLGRIAVRHDEIIRQAARTSAVLPLRMGTVLRSEDSLLATLARCRETATTLLGQLEGRQEWGVRVYQAKHHLDDTAHAGPPSPHRDATDSPGRDYLRRKKADLCKRRELETWVERELQTVQSQLSNQADRCCRVRPLSSQLTGRPEKMVFHAAFLLPEAIKDAWLETVRRVDECIRGKGLLLEVTGPWPPYHFCPPQALTD